MQTTDLTPSDARSLERKLGLPALGYRLEASSAPERSYTSGTFSRAVRHMEPGEARFWLEQLQTARTFVRVSFETEPDSMGFLVIFQRRRVRVVVDHKLYDLYS